MKRQYLDDIDFNNHTCQKVGGMLTKKPKTDSLSTILIIYKKTAEYRDMKFIPINRWLENIAFSELICNQVIWHKECYKLSINKADKHQPIKE